MTHLHRIASATILSGALTLLATAQPPSPDGRTTGSDQDSASTNPFTPYTASPTRSQLRRRSIVHHYPYPYPGYYYDDQTAGFRNPGGVGRFAEFYPPGDKFQEGGQDPVRPAGFDRGGGAPDRAEQLAAQQIGIQRYNAIQQHIDNYARPYFGFGWGVGGFGGFY